MTGGITVAQITAQATTARVIMEKVGSLIRGVGDAIRLSRLRVSALHQIW
jgi:hypothetical protein